jgi:hypothetical protein
MLAANVKRYAAVDHIIDHLKLTFVAEKPPPLHGFPEVALMETDERA